MTLSLRTRLFLTYSILLAVALAVATPLAARKDRSWVVERDTDTLARVARYLLLGLEQAAPSTDRDWTALAAQAGTALGYRVTFIDGEGRVLGDSEVSSARLAHVENHANRPEVKGALAGQASHDVRRSVTVGRDFLYVAVPARDLEGVAVIRLAEPLEQLEKRSASLLALWFGGAALTLAVGLLLAFWMAGRHAARISELARIAFRIGEGELGARAREMPPDEVGRLGAAMNAMSREMRARLAALEQERDEREQILAHMSDGVALLDGQDRVIHANHALAVMVGLAIPPEPGGSIHEFTRLPELKALLQEARQNYQTVEADFQLWGPQQRLLRATATRLHDETTETVLLVLRDRTEEERLNRVRRDFVANVSHELRTPLTSIRGYSETLLEGGLEDVEHREEFVRVIRDSAARLESVTNDLLSLADLERPEVRFTRVSFDLRESIERQLALFRDQSSRRGITIRVEPGPPVPVVADRTRLEQVIANLLDNALKYTEQGTIDVTCGIDGGSAWCEVRDTGGGIAEEHLPRLFERFYRVDKGRSRDRGGTGLGLSIVKHIIELHGGRVGVESRPGVGSTFRFTIPRGDS
jgi:two-component system, OmpR family, phosphate regulon sensor histidine kinase PhoR